MGITNFDKVQANEFIGADFSMTGDTAIGNSATADTLTINALSIAGTSARPLVNDTANVKFVSRYYDCGATSGDARGDYLKLSITGIGGGGEALRAFTDVLDVAAATARGAHISLSLGTTGSVTGLGAAIGSTLHIPGAMTGGTYTASNNEIWADAATSSLAGAHAKSFYRAGIGGDATGVATIDEQVALFDFYGVTAGAGKFINTSITTHTAYAGIPVNIPGVGVRYIALVSD